MIWLVVMAGVVMFAIGNIIQQQERVLKKATALTLVPIYKKWVTEGKPVNPNVTNYVTSTTYNIYVNTNQYMVSDKYKISQFALQSERFGDNDIFIVTTDGEVIFISKNRKPEIILRIDGVR